LSIVADRFHGPLLRANFVADLMGDSHLTLLFTIDGPVAAVTLNRPEALKIEKRGADLPLEAAIESERMAWGILRNTEDRIEGRTAFKEKRTPACRGR
jgi:E-phenylitaconyl-CoA hydratase